MDGVVIKIHNTNICCYENGTIFRFNKQTNEWTKVNNNPVNNKNGYKYLPIEIDGKGYIQSRIIMYAYFGFDLDSSLEIDHIDRNPLNNNIHNLRIVTRQENMYNQGAKGYTKYGNGWRSYIRKNKQLFSKYFKKEEDAKAWYLEKKKELHIITSHTYSQSACTLETP